MYYIIWFLLLFTSFEGFGLRTESWGGLGISGLGWYGAMQLLVLGILLIVPFLFKLNYFFDPKRRMGLPSKLILLLLLIALMQSCIVSLFSNDITIYQIFTNFIKMKYVLMYFIFVYLLSRRNGINIALNSIAISALISSGILLYIVIAGVELPAVKILTSNTIGREFRILLPTGMLISAGFFYMLINFRFKSNALVYLVGVFVCLIPIVLQMHRTILTTFFLTIIYSILKLYRFSIKNTILLILLSSVVVFGVLTVLNEINYSPDKIIDSANSASDDIGSLSGTFGTRVFLPFNSLSYVAKNYFIFGIALNWEEMLDYSEYIDNQFVAGPTLDSSINNIIIVYGILGVIVYTFAFIRLFSVFNYLIKNGNNRIKMSVYPLFFLFVFMILSCISTDNFIVSNATFFFTFILALTYVAEGNLTRTNSNDYIKG